MDTLSVEFDKPKLKRLKKAYADAADNGTDFFVFEGREYVKTYAYYLIEYLEAKLKYLP